MSSACFGCGKEHAQFKCAGCMIAIYCDGKCMKKDWMRHCHECQYGYMARCTIPQRYIQPNITDSRFSLRHNNSNKNISNGTWKYLTVANIAPSQQKTTDDINDFNCGIFYDVLERTCTKDTRNPGEKIYDPIMDESSYEVIKFLGKGAFGVVSVAKDKTSSGNERQIAVKDIRVDHPLKVDQTILRELEITHMFGGTVAGTCKVGSFISKYSPYERHFVMYLERASDDLDKFSKKTWNVINDLESEKSPEFGLLRDDILLSAYQMIASILECHSKFLCSCDIKSPNFLVHGAITDSSHPSPGSRFTRVELSDFGLSCSFCDVPRYIIPCGTLSYSPPESLTAENYTMSLSHDAWSLGIALYELMSGEEYFSQAQNVGDLLVIAYEIEMLNHTHDEPTTKNIRLSYTRSLSMLSRVTANISKVAKYVAQYHMFPAAKHLHMFPEILELVTMILRYRKIDRPNIFQIYEKATALRTAKLSASKGGMTVEEFIQHAIPTAVNKAKWPIFQGEDTYVAYDSRSVIRIYRGMELPAPTAAVMPFGSRLKFYWWYREGVLSFFRDSWDQFGVDESLFVALDIFRRYAYSIANKGEIRHEPYDHNYTQWRNEFRAIYSLAYKYWAKRNPVGSQLETVGKNIITTIVSGDTTYNVEDPSTVDLGAIDEWEMLSAVEYDVSRPTFIQFSRWYFIMNEQFIGDEKRTITALLYLILISSYKYSSGMTQSEMCLQAMCACGKIYGIDVMDEHSSVVRLSRNSLEVFKDANVLKFVTDAIGVLDRKVMEKMNKLIQMTKEGVEKIDIVD